MLELIYNIPYTKSEFGLVMMDLITVMWELLAEQYQTRLLFNGFNSSRVDYIL